MKFSGISRDARLTLCLLAAWAVVAFAISWIRVPYDDEWFSIELALDTDSSRFWHALNQDVHPPWVALLDRAVVHVLPNYHALQAMRVLACVLAISLLATACSRHMGLKPYLFVLAALHPIVVFYGGSVRWYPFLFLAQALRAFAIWSEGASSLACIASFGGGAVLGSLSGYVDAVFVLADVGWLVVRRNALSISRGALAATAAFALLTPAASRWLSPLDGGYHAMNLTRLLGWHPLEILQWLALGIAGETLLPWPFMLTATAAFAAFVWALWRAHVQADTKPVALWLLTHIACWIAAGSTGYVWHPRYSLMLWMLWTALVLRLAQRGSPREQVAVMAGCAHLAIGLVLAISGRGFLKADLNELTADDCAQIAALDPGATVVIPYRRLARLVETRCRHDLHIVRVSAGRVVLDAREQLTAVRAALPARGTVWMLSTVALSSLTYTYRAVRELLDSLCVPSLRVPFGHAPHAWLKRRPSAHVVRFEKERWDCGPATPAVQPAEADAPR